MRAYFDHANCGWKLLGDVKFGVFLLPPMLPRPLRDASCALGFAARPCGAFGEIPWPSIQFRRAAVGSCLLCCCQGRGVLRGAFLAEPLPSRCWLLLLVLQSCPQDGRPYTPLRSRYEICSACAAHGTAGAPQWCGSVRQGSLPSHLDGASGLLLSVLEIVEVFRKSTRWRPVLNMHPLNSWDSTPPPHKHFHCVACLRLRCFANTSPVLTCLIDVSLPVLVASPHSWAIHAWPVLYGARYRAFTSHTGLLGTSPTTAPSHGGLQMLISYEQCCYL